MAQNQIGPKIKAWSGHYCGISFGALWFNIRKRNRLWSSIKSHMKPFCSSKSFCEVDLLWYDGQVHNNKVGSCCSPRLQWRCWSTCVHFPPRWPLRSCSAICTLWSRPLEACCSPGWPQMTETAKKAGDNSISVALSSSGMPSGSFALTTIDKERLSCSSSADSQVFCSPGSKIPIQVLDNSICSSIA